VRAIRSRCAAVRGSGLVVGNRMPVTFAITRALDAWSADYPEVQADKSDIRSVIRREIVRTARGESAESLSFAEDALRLSTSLAILHGAATVAIGALTLGAFSEIARLQSTRTRDDLPPPTRLRRGDPIPVDFGMSIPDRAFLVFLSYGCSGCVDLSRRLETAELRDWTLSVIMRGRPMTVTHETQTLLSVGIAPDGGFALPSRASVFHDLDRAWFKELDIQATPTVLATVGRRLVAQEIGPNLRWFQSVIDGRTEKGRQLLLSKGGAE
jgi:hypothetical protein